MVFQKLAHPTRLVCNHVYPRNATIYIPWILLSKYQSMTTANWMVCLWTCYYRKTLTLVWRGGPLPIVKRQKAFVVPIACFRLFPRLIVTVKDPGKQCNRRSALSWKLGGHVFINICRIGIASAAIMAWDFAISIDMVDQDCFNKHKVSNTDSWAASLPDLSAFTKWGMQRVAASETWSLGKLANMTFKVLKNCTLIVAVDHNSLSRAAAKQSYSWFHN